MVRGVPAMCIRTTPAPRLGDDPGQVGIAAQRRDVVDDRRAGARAPGGRPRPWSCRPRSGPRTRGASASTTGRTRRSSSSSGTGSAPAGSTRRRCRAGRPPRPPAAARARPRRRRSPAPAAVGEAVGRDVDDPHHPGDAARHDRPAAGLPARHGKFTDQGLFVVPRPWAVGLRGPIPGFRYSTTAAPSYPRSAWRGSGPPGRRRSSSISPISGTKLTVSETMTGAAVPLRFERGVVDPADRRLDRQR